jgi:acyl-CoA thioester hydrolase
MTSFRFYYPIQVRYGDLDPQWHVNNARFLSYLEQARLSYLKDLGLFDGHNFLDLGIIVADVHIAYLAPIQPFTNVRVGLRIVRMGTKSINIEYQIEDEDTGQVAARAETVMVSYDYHIQKSVPVPEKWRKVISEFEGIPAGPGDTQAPKSPI